METTFEQRPNDIRKVVMRLLGEKTMSPERTVVQRQQEGTALAMFQELGKGQCGRNRLRGGEGKEGGI